MSFSNMYKYKIIDLAVSYYGSNGDLGFCYLSIVPSTNDVIKEYYKLCGPSDKAIVDSCYDNLKTEIKCGKLPTTVYLKLHDKIIACLEPQKDR
jgi:hypothetical protein